MLNRWTRCAQVCSGVVPGVVSPQLARLLIPTQQISQLGGTDSFSPELSSEYKTLSSNCLFTLKAQKIKAVLGLDIIWRNPVTVEQADIQADIPQWPQQTTMTIDIFQVLSGCNNV